MALTRSRQQPSAICPGGRVHFVQAGKLLEHYTSGCHELTAAKCFIHSLAPGVWACRSCGARRSAPVWHLGLLLSEQERLLRSTVMLGGHAAGAELHGNPELMCPLMLS